MWLERNRHRGDKRLRQGCDRPRILAQYRNWPLPGSEEESEQGEDVAVHLCPAPQMDRGLTKNECGMSLHCLSRNPRASPILLKPAAPKEKHCSLLITRFASLGGSLS